MAIISRISLPNSITPANASAINAYWMSGPNERGTFDILTLCLSTIFIAVWTAYHPNIPTTPPCSRKFLDSLITTAGTIILFLFTPELLLIIAVCEWYEAWKTYSKFGTRKSVNRGAIS